MSAGYQATMSFYVPSGTITNIQAATGNFWVNTSWDDCIGCDGYAILVNGVWQNGTDPFYNNSALSPHGWSNISVWMVTDGELGDESNLNQQIPNNAPVITGGGDASQTYTEGQNVALNFDSIDLDLDSITFTTDAPVGSMSASTGIWQWTATRGVFYWTFNACDTFTCTGTLRTITVNIAGQGSGGEFYVSNPTPTPTPTPTLTRTPIPIPTGTPETIAHLIDQNAPPIPSGNALLLSAAQSSVPEVRQMASLWQSLDTGTKLVMKLVLVGLVIMSIGSGTAVARKKIKRRKQ